MQALLAEKERWKFSKNGDLDTWSCLSLRIQICPKNGIFPTILFWGWDLDHQSYSRDGSGFLGYFILPPGPGWVGIGWSYEIIIDLRSKQFRWYFSLREPPRYPCHGAYPGGLEYVPWVCWTFLRFEVVEKAWLLRLVVFSTLPWWCQCHPKKFHIAMSLGESFQVTLVGMIRCVTWHVNHTVDGRPLASVDS